MAKNHKKLNVHRKKTLTWLKNHKKNLFTEKESFRGGGHILNCNLDHTVTCTIVYSL